MYSFCFKLFVVLAPLSVSGFPSLSSVWNPATAVDFGLPASVFVNHQGLFYHIMIVVYVCFSQLFCELYFIVLLTSLLMNIHRLPEKKKPL